MRLASRVRSISAVSYTHLDVYKRQALGNLDTAKLYEEMYGSIFRAFSAVSQEEIIQAPVAQCTFVDAGPVSYTHLDVYKRQG